MFTPSTRNPSFEAETSLRSHDSDNYPEGPKDADGDRSDDGTDTDLDDNIPVTGFAVASNERNTDFHKSFPSILEGDYLIEGESRLVSPIRPFTTTVQTMAALCSERSQSKVGYTYLRNTYVSMRTCSDG